MKGMALLQLNIVTGNLRISFTSSLSDVTGLKEQ